MSWKSTVPDGDYSELRAGRLKLCVTKETWPNSGWIFRVTIEVGYRYGDEEIARRGGFIGETQARMAAIEWAKRFCEATMVALEGASP